MSECVVRMEMPKSCEDCAAEYDCMACGITGTPWYESGEFNPSNGRLPDCPIICQLPERHGRLGDLDALTRLMLERKQPLVGADSSKDRYRYMQWLADFNAIRDAKTVVPAKDE